MFFVANLNYLNAAPAIEHKLMQLAREKIGYVLDWASLDGFVRELAERQDEIIAANKRLKRVEISVHLNYTPYISCGTSSIRLADVKGIVLCSDSGGQCIDKPGQGNAV